MRTHHKRLFWLGGAVKTPPFSNEARNWTGRMLRRVQRGGLLTMPLSRPMPSVGEHCHELRIPDGYVDWRVVYRIEPDAVLVLEVFNKTTRATPRHVIETCRWRIKRYDQQRKRKGL
jgi:phage-related protein